LSRREERKGKEIVDDVFRQRPPQLDNSLSQFDAFVQSPPGKIEKILFKSSFSPPE